MKNYDWEALMIDDIMGEITPHEKEVLKVEMKKSMVLVAQYAELELMLNGVDDMELLKAPDGLNESFHHMLENEISNESSVQVETNSIKDNEKPKVILRSINWLRSSAAIGLLLVGIAALLWTLKSPDHNEMLAMRQELQETKTLMMTMINESSTSKRIQGIHVSNKIIHPDKELINVLAEKLMEDKSANVRLAAAEALGNYSDLKQVKQSLIKALTKEKEPIVQITLIQMLAQLKEKGALETMDKLLESETTRPVVKDELYKGIMKIT